MTCVTAYPLLEANRTVITSVERRTFSYGTNDTHKLDVYRPADLPQEKVYSYSGGYDQPSSKSFDNSRTKSPVLIFIYGGGLTKGSRAGHSPPDDLVHINLGAFFAKRGFVTVIPDYRLVHPPQVGDPISPKSITYPEGSEDVRDAIAWTIDRLQDEWPELKADPATLFLLAHSAGGVHLSSLLLTPALTSSANTSNTFENVRGIAFLGVPFAPTPSRRVFYDNALLYYGSASLLSINHPMALLKKAPPSLINSLPPLRNMCAASEPKAIASGIRSFTEEWRKKAATDTGTRNEAMNKTGVGIEEVVLEDHDHLSPILALSTGNVAGEQWGEELVQWMRNILLKDVNAE